MNSVLKDGKEYQIPISRRESLVCLFSTITLFSSAWVLGGYSSFALNLLLIGGLCTFFLSIVPLPNSWNGYDGKHGNLKNFNRAFRSPFSWGCLLFLLYVYVQFLNPSVAIIVEGDSWGAASIQPPFGKAFPSSVRAEYAEMNALRSLIIHIGALSCSVGILVGIKRIKTILVLLWAFLMSGVLMGFVAILHKFSGSKLLLWIWESSNQNMWGSFVYRNQGAAFLILVSIVSGVLYFFHQSQIKEDNKGGPHFLCFLCMCLLFASIWLALSRGGIILGSMLILVFCILSLIRFFILSKRGRLKNNLIKFSIIFSLVSILGILFMNEFSNWNEIEKRLNQSIVLKDEINSSNRLLSTKATFNMAKDRIVFGWGAGSFRYIFPIYQQEFKDIWHKKKHVKRGWEGRKIYHYAHNDWIQFLAEYGIVGCLILGILFGYIFNLSIKTCRRNIISGIFFCFGLLLIVLHNSIDFIFSSPAYWVAFWSVSLLIIKLINFNHKFK